MSVVILRAVLYFPFEYICGRVECESVLFEVIIDYISIDHAAARLFSRHFLFIYYLSRHPVITHVTESPESQTEHKKYVGSELASAPAGTPTRSLPDEEGMSSARAPRALTPYGGMFFCSVRVHICSSPVRGSFPSSHDQSLRE